MFHTLYVGLVRLHLEYASEIWNPYLVGDIQTLEKVRTKVHYKIGIRIQVYR